MTRSFAARRTDGEQGPGTTTEGCFRGYLFEAAETQSLWTALARARADYAPRVLAEAEDAVFRWYLPLARELSAGPCHAAKDPIAVEQAAELGLAQAVLGWRQPNCREFERFARGLITERIQRCTAGPGIRIPAPGPAALSPLPGRDVAVAPRETSPRTRS
jgi:hypothetical protein